MLQKLFEANFSCTETQNSVSLNGLCQTRGWGVYAHLQGLLRERPPLEKQAVNTTCFPTCSDGLLSLPNVVVHSVCAVGGHQCEGGSAVIALM